LRCRVPPTENPGFVSFCVTLGNFVLFSEVKHFEYRKRVTSEWENEISGKFHSIISLTLCQARTFKIRVIERLEQLEQQSDHVNKELEHLAQNIDTDYISDDQLDQLFTT
jgi:hypothetical protein